MIIPKRQKGTIRGEDFVSEEKGNLKGALHTTQHVGHPPLTPRDLKGGLFTQRSTQIFQKASLMRLDGKLGCFYLKNGSDSSDICPISLLNFE